jgi:hypothetical protein
MNFEQLIPSQIEYKHVKNLLKREKSKKGNLMEANLDEEAVNDQVPNRCVFSLYTLFC